MPTKPSPPSPSPSPSRERRSVRFSQKLRSLRHLRLGTNDQEEQKSAEGKFQIIHTPDRPARLVSPLEAPTEEECLDEIQGWHSATESRRIRVLPQLHLAVDTDPEAHGDNGEILDPLTFISPARRDSFVTDDGDDGGDIDDLCDWDTSSILGDPHATQPSIGKQLHQPLPRGPDTPEEHFELELETPPAPPPPKEGEGLNEEQVTRLWSQLRKNKDSGRRGSEPRSTASFSCFSSSDDGHYGEVHEAQVVDLEQLKRVEKFRRGTCPYCHKAIIDFTAAFCTVCRADLRSCKGPKPPQTTSTATPAHPRPERRYDSGRPYTTEIEGKATTASPPPKPLKERPILNQSLGGRNPTEARHETPWIPDPRYDERGLSRGQPGGSQGETRDDKAGYNWQSMVPSHVVEGAYAIKSKRLHDTKRNPPSSNPLYSSSYTTSSSSISSTDSRHLPSRLRPPPRLAHRAVLADLKLASSSSTQQLRTRPPPPPPERIFYADGTKNIITRQPRLKLQQSKPYTRNASESSNTHTPPSPSPLRHEITRKEEPNPDQQSAHHSRPRFPAKQYRSPPPPPPPSSTTSPPPTCPPNRPLLIPRSPPQRTSYPHGYTIPASSGVSSMSRPTQSRPLGPEQLHPVPHQPNHPSPLLSDSLIPTRASPPTPTPPMLPSPLMAAILGPQQTPLPPPTTSRLAEQNPNSNLLATGIEQARDTKALPPASHDPPTTAQKDYPASIESLTTSDSSAQVPVFRYDSWMTPAQRAEYERQIAEHGDNADLYMDIFDDYVSDGQREHETETTMRHNRRRTGHGG